MPSLLLYLGAGLVAAWGIAHLVPTRNVVAGFGEISADNRHIIAMEWIVEGVSMLFIGALVIVVTALDPAAPTALAVYVVSATALVALALVSLFTGFRVRFLPFRLCPFVLSVSAALVLTGGLVAGLTA